MYGNTYAIEHYIIRPTSTRNHYSFFRHENMLFAVKDHRFTYQFYSDRTEVRMEIWDSESQRLLSQTSVPFAVWQLLNEQRDEFQRKHFANLEFTENQLGYFPYANQIASDSGFNVTTNDESCMLYDLLDYQHVPTSDHQYEWEEEAGSASNPIVVDDDEGFVENTPPANYVTPTLQRTVNRQLFADLQPDLAEIRGL